MPEKLVSIDHLDPKEAERFVANYPVLQKYMVQQSPLTDVSERTPLVTPQYPTPYEVDVLLTDPVILNAYGAEAYLSTSDLLHRLPIHTLAQQIDGYELFKEIDETMQAKPKAEKISRPRDIHSSLFSNSLDLGEAVADLTQPIIEIGGPIAGWNFSHPPRNPVWVDYYPEKHVQFILDPRHMPFPPHSLSMIFDNYTPWDIRREVSRVLQPGGILISGGPQAIEISQNTPSGLEIIDVIERRRK